MSAQPGETHYFSEFINFLEIKETFKPQNTLRLKGKYHFTVCLRMKEYFSDLILTIAGMDNMKETPLTMPPNWKVFPLSKLHEIEPLKSYMEAGTTGQVL